MLSLKTRRRQVLAMLAVLGLAGQATAVDLRPIVPTVKRSVVGIGTFERTRSPSTVFSGTGFVVGDELHELVGVDRAAVVEPVLDRGFACVVAREGQGGRVVEAFPEESEEA